MKSHVFSHIKHIILNVLPSKGFLPILSIKNIVKIFPGKLETAVIKPSKNTQFSGMGWQISVSLLEVLLAGGWSHGDPPYFSTREKSSGNHIHKP